MKLMSGLTLIPTTTLNWTWQWWWLFNFKGLTQPTSRNKGGEVQCDNVRNFAYTANGQWTHLVTVSQLHVPPARAVVSSLLLSYGRFTTARFFLWTRYRERSRAQMQQSKRVCAGCPCQVSISIHKSTYGTEEGNTFFFHIIRLL